MKATTFPELRRKQPVLAITEHAIQRIRERWSALYPRSTYEIRDFISKRIVDPYNGEHYVCGFTIVVKHKTIITIF